MVESQTGTGKTAAFALPTIQSLLSVDNKKKKKIRILILTPTRELAEQVCASYRNYGKNTKLKVMPVYGGANIRFQIKNLKKGVDIIIATPGRLLDHISRRTINLEEVETIVLDEADRMLDMGFINDIKMILAELPELTQNILISATYSKEIRQLAQNFTNNPIKINIKNRRQSGQLIDQFVFNVTKNSEKIKALLKIIKKFKFHQLLVFTRTKFGAEKLGLRLRSLDLKVEIIHGNKLQHQRKKSLAKFREKRTDILVATDVAARGLDIEQLPCVINYDIPNQPNDYVHRIGRTGRAGRKGVAISIASLEEKKWIKKIENQLKIRIREMPEWLSTITSNRSKPKSSMKYRLQKKKKLIHSPKENERKSKIKKAKSRQIV
ncbi:MAG: ATP-dependent RNA helicase RhlE [Proteobacteria bacterium]|nr:ATP-dependent RNA helicase RhlE [Pseudomonadota bacterium]